MVDWALKPIIYLPTYLPRFLQRMARTVTFTTTTTVLTTTTYCAIPFGLRHEQRPAAEPGWFSYPGKRRKSRPNWTSLPAFGDVITDSLATVPLNVLTLETLTLSKFPCPQDVVI